MILYLLSIIWIFRQIKYTLFWIYLWQLKEYHIGRFLSHFATSQGRNLFLNKLLLLKLILLIIPFFLEGENYYYVLSLCLLFLYALEFLKLLKDFIFSQLKAPVWTVKTIFLFLTTLAAEVFYLWVIVNEKDFFYSGLILFDIFTPLLISLAVLLFQPLSFLWRVFIIRRAIQKRDKFKNLKVVGITGSYGKTSTKEFLAAILEQKFNVLKTKKHQNSEVGVSSAILKELKPSHEVFVVEMGAYNKGGIKLLCDIAKPKIGILTGINAQHLATFGSPENIINTKYELIESLPEDGTAIFNGNNQYCQNLYQKTRIPKKISFSPFSTRSGRNIWEDFWAEDIKVEKEKITFNVFSRDGESAFFELKELGAHNIENILLAVCCAKELGMSLDEISKACLKIERQQGSMILFEGVNGSKVIDSTYSANSTGVFAHLDYLDIWESKKVIVMPCLIELGLASRAVHKKIGERIGRTCNLAIITTEECFDFIKRGAIEQGMKKDNILLIKDPQRVIEKVESFVQAGDVVLLESRIPKQIIDSLVAEERRE